jgi:hypothetical protein
MKMIEMFGLETADVAACHLAKGGMLYDWPLERELGQRIDELQATRSF